MSVRLEVKSDGILCYCTVEDDTVVLLPKTIEPCPDEKGSSVDAADHSFTLAFDDIIAIKKEDSTCTGSTESFVDHPNPSSSSSTIIHYIKKVPDDPKWSHATVKISPSSEKECDYKIILEKVQAKFDKVVETRPNKLLVLMNPIGGKRQARTMYDTVMTPLFELANISCHLIVSERPKHLIEVLKTYDYKSMDGIVMMGGDGTFTEIINVLMRKTQEEAGVDYNDPTAKLQRVSTPLAVIPTGTGNGVAEGLIGCQDVLTATLHVIRGKIRTNRILATYADSRLVGYSGCVFGIGLAADMMYIADKKLRWLKAARYLALPFVFMLRGIRHTEAEFTMNIRKRITMRDGSEQHEEFVFEEEKINQETSMVMSWPFQLLDDAGHFNLFKSCIRNVTRKHNGDMFMVIYERMGWLQMLQHFRDLHARKDGAFEKDFIKIRRCQSIKIRLKEKPGESSIYNRLVSIDGELQECENPEYFVRILDGALNLFCSTDLV
ncbi:ceramide kinase-like [Mizuhopecten yessoensis]|uniref:Ceramide kinase n=1 Tax=Mizuhopecten yessoensis TaxID=6573 RepID=A0A210R0X7_MIZYE|nr:ceramide kinase-like [Mizuhopecten yessoensis]OWF54541.1 Ceramide kinase [Mizuhopecten yessoensis]